MPITIDLPPDLEQNLRRQAAQSNVPLQTLIIQVLGQLAQSTPTQVSPQASPQALQWPDTVLAYQGTPDFPAFESYRDELLPPQEIDLF